MLRYHYKKNITVRFYFRYELHVSKNVYPAHTFIKRFSPSTNYLLLSTVFLRIWRQTSRVPIFSPIFRVVPSWGSVHVNSRSLELAFVIIPSPHQSPYWSWGGNWYLIVAPPWNRNTTRTDFNKEWIQNTIRNKNE